MKKILLLAGLAGLLLSLIFSCFIPDAGAIASGPAAVPGADLAELSGLPVDGTFLSWQAIRAVALMEFESGDRDKLAPFGGERLAERPVVVYDASWKPFRFEYAVLNRAGEAVATVATVARAGMTTSAISEIFTSPRRYPAPVSGAERVYAIAYPNELGSAVPGSAVPRGAEGTDADDDAGATAERQLELLSDADLLALGCASRENLRAEILTVREKARAESQAFWRAVGEHSGALAAMSDAEIIASVGAQSAVRKTVTSGNYYVVSNYCYGQGSADLTRTWWTNGAYCGPAALCNAYLGISRFYNGLDLGGAKFFSFYGADGQMHGSDRDWVAVNEYYQDAGLYYNLADKSGCFLTGSWILATSFDSSIRSVTNNAYGVFGALYDASGATNRMRSSNLPMIWWVQVDHYCTVIGGDVQTTYYVLGPLKIQTGQSRKLLVKDNGYLYGCTAYWRTVDNAAYFLYPLTAN